VERRPMQRPDTPSDDDRRHHEHDEAICDGPADELADHGFAPRCVSPVAVPCPAGVPVEALSRRDRADLRLASESMRNCPDVTTRIPSESPDLISMSDPAGRPSVTSTGEKRLSSPATMTTLRLPVAMTASCGTSSTASLDVEPRVTETNIPGFRTV